MIKLIFAILLGASLSAMEKADTSEQKNSAAPNLNRLALHDFIKTAQNQILVNSRAKTTLADCIRTEWSQDPRWYNFSTAITSSKEFCDSMLSPNGRYLAVTCGSYCIVRSSLTSDIVAEFTTARDGKISWSPDNNFILVTGHQVGSNFATLITLNTNQSRDFDLGARARFAKFSKDGKELYVSYADAIRDRLANGVKRYNLSTSAEIPCTWEITWTPNPDQPLVLCDTRSASIIDYFEFDAKAAERQLGIELKAHADVHFFTIHVKKLSDENFLTKFETSGPICALQLSNDGNILVVKGTKRIQLIYLPLVMFTSVDQKSFLNLTDEQLIALAQLRAALYLWEHNDKTAAIIEELMTYFPHNKQ